MSDQRIFVRFNGATTLESWKTNYKLAICGMIRSWVISAA